MLWKRPFMKDVRHIGRCGLLNMGMKLLLDVPPLPLSFPYKQSLHEETALKAEIAAGLKSGKIRSCVAPDGCPVMFVRPVTALIDTGAQGNLLISQAAVSLLGLPVRRRSPLTLRSFTIGNSPSFFYSLGSSLYVIFHNRQISYL